MEEWLKLSLMLCTFGILREFRPSEPYVTKYLNNPPMNFTINEITSEIYPINTYASMILLIIIFLCTDLLRYKPIIVLNALSGVIVYIMLIVCRSLFEMQVLEVLYGLFSACDVAYCTYIYSKVDKEHYQVVTSHTHGAYLAGRAISGITSQILVLTDYFSYYSLNFFTLVAMILATVWAFFLPSAEQSVYFHRALPENVENQDLPQDLAVEYIGFRKQLVQGFKFLYKDLCAAFTSSYVVKWIFWWALATSGYYQVLSYIQVLWEVIDEEKTGRKDSKWNGAVEAAYTLLSMIATLLCGVAKVDWNRFSELVLAVCSLAIGAILFIASQTQFVYVAYVADVLAKIIYHGMITIANSEVAKNINPDSYALIFGITTFLALCLQSLLTLIVITLLRLEPRAQFVVYSVYFALLGFYFAITATVSYFRKRKFPLDSEEDSQTFQGEARLPETARLHNEIELKSPLGMVWTSLES